MDTRSTAWCHRSVGRPCQEGTDGIRCALGLWQVELVEIGWVLSREEGLLIGDAGNPPSNRLTVPPKWCESGLRLPRLPCHHPDHCHLHRKSTHRTKKKESEFEGTNSSLPWPSTLHPAPGTTRGPFEKCDWWWSPFASQRWTVPGDLTMKGEPCIARVSNGLQNDKLQSSSLNIDGIKFIWFPLLSREFWLWFPFDSCDIGATSARNEGFKWSWCDYSWVTLEHRILTEIQISRADGDILRKRQLDHQTTPVPVTMNNRRAPGLVLDLFSLKSYWGNGVSLNVSLCQHSMFGPSASSLLVASVPAGHSSGRGTSNLGRNRFRICCISFLCPTNITPIYSYAN